ncbi:MAG: ribosomal protein S18-alanine N-acetyltransferase [Dehalococcoidales bacterium]|nr:ribosomal protein S18-alanine N-acetyltransferase [Dehalococcoidales bacterium]
MALYIRKIQLSDVNQVTEIDREAFSTQWPPPNYKREMQNGLSHHVVIIDDTVMARSEEQDSGNSRATGLITRIGRWLGFYRQTDGDKETEYIIGFAGLWIIADEAHVTAIAVREKYRGRKIGALLMVALIDLAVQLKARSLTLEVRVSNKVAQNLYTKFGFKEVGLRRGYYTDNREDAVLMSTEGIDSASFQERLEQLKQDYLRTSKQILRENIFTGNL